MTQYLQTKTDIFAAAMSHAGISDITSYWGEGYWGYSYSSLASANSYPWNARDMYTLQSPLFNADKINTPICSYMEPQTRMFRLERASRCLPH